MLADLYENYETDNDEVIELPELEAAHRELINETIKEQIADPFDSNVNYVDEYFNMMEKQLDRAEENPDLRSQIVSDGKKFCQEVLGLLDKKYNLDLNDEELEDMNLEDLQPICCALYDFFTVHYARNLKKFFIKYIIQNIDTINDAMQSLKDKNDVVTTSMRGKLTDERAAIIIANLRKVIDYIDDLDLDGLEVLSYYNSDRYDIYIITNAINDLIIGENFVRPMFKMLTVDYEDENFTDVYISIESGLIKKFKKLALE